MKAQIRQKRALTLIEIMVAIALLVVLSSFLLGYYRGLVLQKHQAQVERERSFGRRRAHSRLCEVLASARPDSVYTTVVSGRFAQGQCLTFVYENHAVLDPELSGAVIGRLYFQPGFQTDAGGQLCLATWPLDQSQQLSVPDLPMTKEVLFEGVDSVDYSLYTLSNAGEDEEVDGQSVEEARSRSTAFVLIRIKESAAEEAQEYAIPVARGLRAVRLEAS